MTARHSIAPRPETGALVRIFAGLAAGATLMTGVFVVAAASPPPPSEVPPAAPAVVAPTPVDEPYGDGSLPGSGTYVVGADARPGTYTSAGAAGGLHGVCYWSRLARLDRRAEATIQSGAGRVDDPQTVTVDARDAVFKTAGCRTWEPAP